MVFEGLPNDSIAVDRIIDAVENLLGLNFITKYLLERNWLGNKSKIDANNVKSFD